MHGWLLVTDGYGAFVRGEKNRSKLLLYQFQHTFEYPSQRRDCGSEFNDRECIADIKSNIFDAAHVYLTFIRDNFMSWHPETILNLS